MELCKIKKSDYSHIKSLYTEAFPSDERAPFRLLKKRAEKGKADFWIIKEEEKNIGLAYLVTNNDLAYLFYYAIDLSYRGKGYGTKALKALIKNYKNYRLFLALEDWREECENKVQRIKRHDFYINCGLHDLPYKLKEATVIYAIMGTGDAVEPEEYKALMNKYAGFPMKLFVDMRIIKD